MAGSRAHTRVHAREGKRRPRPRLPLFTGELITREQLPSPKEIALQCALADFLSKWAHPEWRWTHFPAGELRNPKTAAKLQRMGTKPGWPDLIFVSPEGRFHGLELKRRGEGLNEAQKDFHGHAIAQGWAVAVVDTFDDAVAVFKHWGCLRINLVEIGQ